MKANELRIGNYVNYNEDPFVIKMIRDREYNDFIPIPLTEEWLLKFGFELQYGFGGIRRYYKDRYLIEKGISQFFDNGMSFRITINNTESTHANSIKYVHQLQNLYFALTGEELEIKEK